MVKVRETRCGYGTSAEVFVGNYYSFVSISGCISNSEEIRFYLATVDISMDCFFFLEGCLLNEVSISGSNGFDVEICGVFIPCQTVEFSYNILPGSGKWNLIDSGTYVINNRNVSGMAIEYAGNVGEGLGFPVINAVYTNYVWVYITSSNFTVSNVKLVDLNNNMEWSLVFVDSGTVIFGNVEFSVSNVYVSYIVLLSYNICPLLLINSTFVNAKVYYSVVYDLYENNVSIISSKFSNITSNYPIRNFRGLDSRGAIYDQFDSSGSYKVLIQNSVIESVFISDNKTLIMFGGGSSESEFRIVNSSIGNVITQSSVTNYIIYVNRSIPIILFRNSTFSFLSGSYRGGAVYLSCEGVQTTNTTHIFTNCTFKSNRGISGGAIYIKQINIYFNNCTFVNNSIEGCGYVDGLCETGHDIHVEGGSGTFYSSSTFKVFFFFNSN
jgi:hypothetical protein